MISILVPIFNYHAYPLVFELQKQCTECKINFEILCQDDASKSPLNKFNEVINALPNCSFISLNENLAHRENRNALAEKAIYDYLLFIDGDSIIIDNNYIQKYINTIPSFDVVYGGRKHPEKCPSSQQKLRWKYGKFIEDKSAKLRKKAPFKSLLFNNTLIRKVCFDKVKFDKTKISIKNKDSLAVDFTTEYDEFNQKLYLDFKKEPLENYKIQLLPGAMVDFFDTVNDTLNYKVKTKNLSDYGNLRLVLENVKRFPVIIELTDKDGKVKYSEYSEGSNAINFDAIEPAKYVLRIIYDDNKNKLWDTGSFMEKRQTEEVIYFPKEIDVRANWDVEQPFNLK